MNKEFLKIVVWFLIAAIAGLLILKALQLNKTSFALDDLDTRLAVVKSRVKQHAVISYYSNVNSSSSFVETSFVMAPTKLLNDLSRDTILVMQSKTKGLKPFDRYKVLVQTNNGDMVTLLLKKQ